MENEKIGALWEKWYCDHRGREKEEDGIQNKRGDSRKGQSDTRARTK